MKTFKGPSFFLQHALALEGFRSLQHLEDTATKRRWNASTLIRKRQKVEQLQEALFLAYQNGLEDSK